MYKMGEVPRIPKIPTTHFSARTRKGALTNWYRYIPDLCFLILQVSSDDPNHNLKVETGDADIREAWRKIPGSLGVMKELQNWKQKYLRRIGFYREGKRPEADAMDELR